MHHRILIADGLASEGLKKIQALPNVECMAPKDAPRKSIKELLSGTTILIVRSRTLVDRDLLLSGPGLKLVIRAGIGLDNIDVTAATDLGIAVMNAPTGNIVTTAEHALSLLMSLSRRIPQADASMRAGKWDKKSFQGNEIQNKTLGILGCGNIGRALAERALGLKMKVVAHDPFLGAEAASRLGIRLASFSDLLAQSDYVSIHVPLMDSTRNLIDQTALSKMKRGAFLINCARGGIVDESALVEALDKKWIAGAALDVFSQEPLPAGNPLIGRSDVILTPHLGASTDEAQVQVGNEVADQLASYIEDGAFRNAVNVPNISAAEVDRIRPYLSLCEKLGSFAAQAHSEELRRISIKYCGLPEGVNTPILGLSLVQGLLKARLSGPVNFVNAKKVLKERGLELQETVLESGPLYHSSIELTLESDHPRTFVATLFGKREPRLVAIDEFAIDAILSGQLLLTRNEDTPGVIGLMGGLLGSFGVNIGRMHLGRSEKKNEAIALISVDTPLHPEQVEQFRQIKGILEVTPINLANNPSAQTDADL